MRIALARAALLLCMCTATSQHTHAQHMTTGAYELPPFGLTHYCLLQPDRCRASANHAIRLDKSRMAELRAVNASVNRSVIPESDGSATRPWRDDGRRGDCKEYALSKRTQLLALGWPASALLIARARIPDGQMHAVLVVVTDRGDLVLDNLRTTIVRYEQLPYRWIDRMTPENPKFWRRVLSWLRSNPGPFLCTLFWRLRLRRPRSIALKQRPRDRAIRLGPFG